MVLKINFFLKAMFNKIKFFFMKDNNENRFQKSKTL